MSETTPGYIYDPDDWDATYEWGDRADLLDNVELDAREIKKYHTLIEGPPKFAARVPVSFDDDGDPDRCETRWFDSEAEAKAAVSKTPEPPND